MHTSIIADVVTTAKIENVSSTHCSSNETHYVKPEAKTRIVERAARTKTRDGKNPYLGIDVSLALLPSSRPSLARLLTNSHLTRDDESTDRYPRNRNESPGGSAVDDGEREKGPKGDERRRSCCTHSRIPIARRNHLLPRAGVRDLRTRALLLCTHCERHPVLHHVRLFSADSNVSLPHSRAHR